MWPEYSMLSALVDAPMQSFAYKHACERACEGSRRVNRDCLKHYNKQLRFPVPCWVWSLPILDGVMCEHAQSSVFAPAEQICAIIEPAAVLGHVSSLDGSSTCAERTGDHALLCMAGDWAEDRTPYLQFSPSPCFVIFTLCSSLIFLLKTIQNTQASLEFWLWVPFVTRTRTLHHVAPMSGLAFASWGYLDASTLARCTPLSDCS